LEPVTAVVVNWNSGNDLAAVITDLAAQVGVDLTIVVVDNASTDDSLARALATAVAFRVERADRNLGYTGGNNLGAQLAGADADVLIVNPDVRLPDANTVAALVACLHANPTRGAVAPAIEESDGRIEYLDSEIDLARARAVHTDTHVPAPESTEPVDLAWIDGAVMLIRAEARAAVGLFDDRFFLIDDEVDWCLRARAAGWSVALCPAVRVEHQRSSSFGDSKKASYYYWRNRYLLCRLHATSPRWRLHWAANLLRYVVRRETLRTGNAVVALRGARDAILGRYGPAPEDSSATMKP
jgi:GT2 family glycosyltransferase